MTAAKNAVTFFGGEGQRTNLGPHLYMPLNDSN